SGPDALVVRLSSFAGDRRGRADVVLPVPAWLEEYRDVCAPAAGPSFGIAVPFIDPPSGVIDRAALLHRIATAAGMPFDAPATAVDVVRSRVAAVHAEGRGELLRFADGERIAVAGIGSAEALWQTMMSGAGWFDRSAPRLTLPSFRLLGPCEDGFERLLAEAEASDRRAAAGGNVPLWLMPFGLPGTVGEGPVPALACKLYRESDLRLRPGCIAVSPATARALSLREGRRVVLQIPAGRLQVEVRLDPLVLPGVAHIPVGPAPERPPGAEEAGRLIASLRAPGGHVARRMIPAHVVEA
ncbi:MAG TPA: molybdopterin dinucleotide binding domain-containing protein, partial [Candidatus Polarisedimenticolia bacterium]|nr:molybdopterin dinucleotide binding domain-containing protein [Candidatus Polarisedimenticolia bacterium]